MTINRWAIVATVALICGQAMATPLGTVEATYEGGILTDGKMTIWGGGRVGRRIRAGMYWINNNASAATGAGALLPDGLIPVFCIDLEQAIRNGTLEYNVIEVKDASDPGTRPSHIPGGPAMGADRAKYLSELWGRYFTTASASGSAAEAFAAAVWEVLYEELPDEPADWDVTVGPGFRATGLNSALANTWLHTLDLDNGAAPRADLGALSSSVSQDFVAEFPSPLVPEPLTCSLIVLGSMALLRKRR